MKLWWTLGAECAAVWSRWIIFDHRTSVCVYCTFHLPVPCTVYLYSNGYRAEGAPMGRQRHIPFKVVVQDDDEQVEKNAPCALHLMRRWELYQSWNCIRVRTSSMLQQSLKTTTMTMTLFFVGEREEFVCLFLLIRLDIVHGRLVWELQSQLKLPTARWLERDECPGPLCLPSARTCATRKNKRKNCFFDRSIALIKT